MATRLILFLVFLSFLLLAVFSSVAEGSGSNKQDRKFWKVFSGDVLKAGATVSASGVPSVTRCAALCVSKSWCLSLAFQASSQQCWLYPNLVQSNETGVQSAPATRYYWIRQRTCPSELGYTLSSSYQICYRVLSQEISWFQASDLCTADGGRLFVGNSVQRHDFLINVIAMTIRIGGSDEASEGNWVWVNGDPVTGPWDSGYPRTDRGINCLTFDLPDGYYDGRCSYASRDYLCEVPLW